MAKGFPALSRFPLTFSSSEAKVGSSSQLTEVPSLEIRNLKFTGGACHGNSLGPQTSGLFVGAAGVGRYHFAGWHHHPPKWRRRFRIFGDCQKRALSQKRAGCLGMVFFCKGFAKRSGGDHCGREEFLPLELGHWSGLASTFSRNIQTGAPALWGFRRAHLLEVHHQRSVWPCVSFFN